MLDTTNPLTYPSLAPSHRHAAVELFDDWAGGLLPVGGMRTLGIYLNRSPRPARDLSSYVESTGSRLFRSLQPRQWLDLLYGDRLSSSFAYGIALGLAYDVQERGAIEASAIQNEIKVGVTLGGPARLLDLSLGLQRVGLTDGTLEQTGGSGLLAEARGRWRIDERTTVTPVAAIELTAYGLSPETRERTRVKAGVAMSVRPTPSVLAIAGILVEADETGRTPTPGAPNLTDRVRVLPALIAGGEVGVGSMVFRLGISHRNLLVDRDVLLRDGSPINNRSSDTDMDVSVGLGFVFGDLLLDGVIEKDFLRDGPHLIGGSRHGGGILSTLSLTYQL
ncbi:MAG: hypothetical protein VX733_06895 [Candidatus Latescibacterota bacterium]|nr:hypothetical protein [Candidatus Latescibacterota bacterium]